MKWLLLVMMGMVVFALFSALVPLASTTGDRVSMVRSLTWRISLSVVLFVSLWLAAWQEWIEPHALLGPVQ